MIELLDEEKMLQDSIRDFFKKELEPVSEAIEADHDYTLIKDLIKKMGDLGFLGTFFPKEYGGSEMSLLSRAIVCEETARVSAGFDITLFADIVLFARALSLHGNEAQKQKYLVPVIAGDKIGSLAISEPEAGSDAFSIRSTAVKKGGNYIINGNKTFITNAPIADYMLVIARTSKGQSKIKGGTWFILARGMPGLSTGKPFNKLGMRSSPTGEIFLQDVSVPASQVLGNLDEGFHYMVESLDVERLMEGASTVGIAQACLEASVAYAVERQAFGKSISTYQMIQEKLAEMAMGIEISRSYLYNLCRMADAGKKITKQASMLKLYSSTITMKAAQDAVQIHGGYGYMEDNKIARYFRDAKHHEIGAGTSEIQKTIIAREIIKELSMK
jgi:alkylation response protein AidB-like acyl-CoA dehydrogenase